MMVSYGGNSQDFLDCSQDNEGPMSAAEYQSILKCILGIHLGQSCADWGHRSHLGAILGDFGLSWVSLGHVGAIFGLSYKLTTSMQRHEH